MKTMALLVLLSALAAVGSVARAQMVVDRDRGEQVDRPYAAPFYAHRHGRHHARPRFLAVQSAFPRTQPFGAVECCL